MHDLNARGGHGTILSFVRIGRHGPRIILCDKARGPTVVKLSAPPRLSRLSIIGFLKRILEKCEGTTSEHSESVKFPSGRNMNGIPII